MNTGLPWYISSLWPHNILYIISIKKTHANIICVYYIWINISICNTWYAEEREKKMKITIHCTCQHTFLTHCLKYTKILVTPNTVWQACSTVIHVLWIKLRVLKAWAPKQAPVILFLICSWMQVRQHYFGSAYLMHLISSLGNEANT